jgi:enamine deaminase RidA (YjgF/YER057c/UK114 family)
LFVSGQASVDSRRSVLALGDVKAQATRALDSLQAVLEQAGGSLDDVVDVMSFHTDIREIDAVFDVARRYFPADQPAWTPVGMSGSYSEGIAVTIRAIAHLGEDQKRCYTPDSLAWLRELPISAACRKGDHVFVSAGFASTPEGAAESPGDHRRQARRAYEHVREAVEAAGASMSDVLDICSFHVDPRGMIDAERVHMETWQGTPIPNAAAWTAIAVPGLYRPRMQAQYRVIADLAPGQRIARTPASIHWKDTPNSGGSRKQHGMLIGIAGEVASDAEGNVTTPGDTLGQARYAFNRIREVVEMHGSSMDKVVEVTSFHKDHRAWKIVMDAGREYFDPDDAPAWTPVGAVGLWNPGYLHEIYALAVT